ncbi:NAD(P)H-hydrate dehydratase [Rubrolithibacter danxiaensis]|uniref:NAD(P)H-hydrate dehydratase n=1 Tax=Rubrolithibacter danxiaensis TaxID=3390805 RepID=UPI003BF8F8EF
MLKLLTAQQTRQADAYTIRHHSIASIDLMENASHAFVAVFADFFPDKNATVAIYCGTGNNGGDGLAVARLLKDRGYEKVTVRIARYSDKETADFKTNLLRLQTCEIPIVNLHKHASFRAEDADVIVDALLGTGLNKLLEGDWQNLAEFINSLNKPVVSIDIPTGFFSEGTINAEATAIKADLVITFQRPKINFLLPESAKIIKRFLVADIGLNEQYIQSSESPFLLATEQDIREKLKKRSQFSHKGTFGHALIIAGNAETMGAALLSSEACLYAGAGLTTACVPSEGLSALNTRTPEVMALLRRDGLLPDGLKWDKYDAVGIGPGLGTTAESKRVLETTLQNVKTPLLLDADAINLISIHRDLIPLVPQGTVITPHVKEFDRLFGEHKSWWDRIETALKKSKDLGWIIILKNRYTMIFSPNGDCVFNPTGDPAMATGGMGDTLTGIITSLLAQGYNAKDASIAGVYIHGKAGEDLAKEMWTVVSAGELIKRIPVTIGALQD